MHFKSPHPDLDIPKVSVLDFFYPANAEPSDKPLWIDAHQPARFLSSRGARSWICRLGLGLQNQGVGSGDVCMVFSTNHIFVPVAYLGVLSCGAIFSGINAASTATEAAFQISTTGAKVMLVHPDLLGTALKAAETTGLPKERIFLFSDQPNESQDGVQDWRSMIAGEEQAGSWKWKSLTQEEATTQVATLNFSSGTTGLPKGVSVSHRSIIANTMQLPIMYNLSKPKRWVGFLPLYHAYGQCFYILIASKYQIPVYIMKAFQFEEYLRIIQTHRITSLQTVPPVLMMLDKRPETSRYDLSSVEEVLCGAAPLSTELQQAVTKKLGVMVVQAYGTTETTCGVMANPWFSKKRYAGSVGLILPNTEIKLLDDDGHHVSTGERGEVYAKGPQIALNYWKNEKSTKESFDSDGWYRTGDIGLANEDGFFWIVDRKKELIKVKGLQVSPAELEAILWENPAVADAAVVGLNLDDRELPRAYVVLKDGSAKVSKETEISAWVKSKVSRHKWLEGGVVVVDEVPRLASGKIQRKVLREWAKRDAQAVKEGKIILTRESKL